MSLQAMVVVERGGGRRWGRQTRYISSTITSWATNTTNTSSTAATTDLPIPMVRIGRALTFYGGMVAIVIAAAGGATTNHWTKLASANR